MQYVAIIKHYSVFAEYSDYNDNFQDLIVKIFIANKQNIEFYVIPYMNQYEIFFLHHKEYVFSSICTPNMNTEQILVYLQSLKVEFCDLIENEKNQLTLKSTKLIKNTLQNFFQQQMTDKFKLVEKEIESVTKEKHSLLNSMIDRELKLDVEIENSNKLLGSVNFLFFNFFKLKLNLKF